MDSSKSRSLVSLGVFSLVFFIVRVVFACAIVWIMWLLFWSLVYYVAVSL